MSRRGISAALIELVDAGCALVLPAAPARRDVTPEATLAVTYKEMPGFASRCARSA
jgi:molybdopterin adenylyltransferase